MKAKVPLNLPPHFFVKISPTKYILFHVVLKSFYSLGQKGNRFFVEFSLTSIFTIYVLNLFDDFF